MPPSSASTTSCFPRCTPTDSNWVYTGDLLRLGAYLFFLVAATRDISTYWSDQARLAAVEERRRLARDLHDGFTQELAFIRSQSAAMAGGTVIPGMALT